MLNIWTLNTGSSLGSLNEGTSYTIPLPVTSGVNAEFRKISGHFPKGMRLEQDKIVGTPFEVSQPTTFSFVIRASNNGSISDRTFTITINGADDPVWVTPEGAVPIGPNGQLFLIENTYVDFSLSVKDNDLPAGDLLEFFIQQGDGNLPPGLELHPTGRITGKVDLLRILDIGSGSGYFDSNLFDSNLFDFGLPPISADALDTIKIPRKISRHYEFFVTVSDRRTVTKRKFDIYVVSEEFLRSDNTILQLGNGAFTADNTYLRSPIWLTSENLRIRRASNYVTIFLDAYDPTPESGPLVYTHSLTNNGIYRLNSTGEITKKGKYEISQESPVFHYRLVGNWDTQRHYHVGDAVYLNRKLWVCQANNTGNRPSTVSPHWDRSINIETGTFKAKFSSSWTVIEPQSHSMLPPGIFLDPDTAELFGYAPSQSSITKNYKFTINAVKYDLTASSEVEVTIVVKNPAQLGQSYIDINRLPESDIEFITDDNIRINERLYKVLSYQEITNGNNGTYGRILLDHALTSDVPSAFIIKRRYIQSVIPTIDTPKQFQIMILGDVDSKLMWNSSFDLGMLKANFQSMLQVSASSSVSNAQISYKLVGGKLPPGLTLNNSGEIVGKVRQFNDIDGIGLITYDNNTTSFDGGITSFDREYLADIQAEDQYKYSAITGRFKISVKDQDSKRYSNIYARPYQKLDKRSKFYEFINDSNIFDPRKIYRQSDPFFGIRTNLEMLIYAGIETVTADDYATGLTKNIKRKRYRLGDPTVAIAKHPGSNQIEYEVIYLPVIDDYGSVKEKIKLKSLINSPVLINQVKYDSATGNLSSLVNQEKLNRAESDIFRPINDTLTIDSTLVNASAQDREYVYPSSITNIRKNIKKLTKDFQQLASENEFLPLWMKTPQSVTTAAPGYTAAIPLCYCKPSQGNFILENILNYMKNTGFRFNNLDYEIDRFIVDSTTGSNQEQYLKIGNSQFTV